jgi:hypothetical protein
MCIQGYSDTESQDLTVSHEEVMELCTTHGKNVEWFENEKISDVILSFLKNYQLLFTDR